MEAKTAIEAHLPGERCDVRSQVSFMAHRRTDVAPFAIDAEAGNGTMGPLFFRDRIAMNVPLPKYAERGPIHDVIWVPLKFYHDSRGWLVELFRNDLIDPKFHPVMAYVSQTKPGIARGPHEHIDQADYFCFTGPSTFRVYLWDARSSSPTHGKKEVRDVGENSPYALIVPAGVVHAYRNVGEKDGLVFNAANRLYAGWLKQDPVDEIRHEAEANSPYQID